MSANVISAALPNWAQSRHQPVHMRFDVAGRYHSGNFPSDPLGQPKILYSTLPSPQWVDLCLLLDDGPVSPAASSLSATAAIHTVFAFRREGDCGSLPSVGRISSKDLFPGRTRRENRRLSSDVHHLPDTERPEVATLSFASCLITVLVPCRRELLAARGARMLGRTRLRSHVTRTTVFCDV